MNASLEVISNHFNAIANSFEGHVVSVLNNGINSVIAQADGQTPVDNGMLKGNKTITYASGGSFASEVTWNQSYAIYVNGGTYKMAARPFADNAFDAVSPGVQADLATLGF